MSDPTQSSVEQRAQLQASATVNANGEFEILAINVGAANGWTFTENVLRESIALWDGASCFVDHIGLWDDHQSVRNLGGVVISPMWSDSIKGVQGKLKTMGPSGPLVAELGRQMLAENEPKPKIGFSADIGFTATGREVKQILRVYSLDLVFDPARGGAFLRALNSVQNDSTRRMPPGGFMSDLTITAPAALPTNPNSAVPSTGNADVAVTPEFLQVQRERQQLAQEAEAARQVREQMCAYLLDSGLAASRLPVPMQDDVRMRFSGRVFETSELTAAIEQARNLVSALTGPGAVVGPRANVHSMFNGGDQLRLAVEDMLGVERAVEEKAVKVARLSGIKELYLGMTGDVDLYGAVYPERARFQHTTTTFAGLVKNALNKAIVRHWNELGRAGYDWWQKIAHIEHFDTLKQITWVIFGTVGSLPTITEGGEYTELKIADSPETTNFAKYGGYIGLTLEAIDRDETRKLRMVPRELANAGVRNISALVAAIFTDNAGVGPTLADTGALFNSTVVTTAGGHANLLTTALGTDYTAWNAAALAMYNQPMLIANETGYYGAGKKMAVDPKFCLVPRALKAQAEALFIPRWSGVVEAGIAAAGGPTYGGAVVPLTVPEWTDATDWAAVADPLIVPSVCVGERFGLMPEVFIAGDEQSPAVFMNDESRIKVRHFVAVGVCDFRPVHKNNVA